MSEQLVESHITWGQPEDGFTVNRAILVADAAHAEVGQRDKGTGGAYFWHPYRVMRALEGHDDEMLKAAVLHDTVEDTRLTLIDLRNKYHASVIVTDTVDALSKRPGESYDSALYRAKEFYDSTLVKIADNRDHSDPSQRELLSPEDLAKNQARYPRAFDYLVEDDEFALDAHAAEIEARIRELNRMGFAKIAISGGTFDPSQRELYIFEGPGAATACHAKFKELTKATGYWLPTVSIRRTDAKDMCIDINYKMGPHFELSKERLPGRLARFKNNGWDSPRLKSKDDPKHDHHAPENQADIDGDPVNDWLEDGMGVLQLDKGELTPFVKEIDRHYAVDMSYINIFRDARGRPHHYIGPEAIINYYKKNDVEALHTDFVMETYSRLLNWLPNEFLVSNGADKDEDEHKVIGIRLSTLPLVAAIVSSAQEMSSPPKKPKSFPEPLGFTSVQKKWFAELSSAILKEI